MILMGDRLIGPGGIFYYVNKSITYTPKYV